MSDGTMATISPVQESDEMTHIRSIFDRAANAIVEASELNKQVQELRSTVDALKQDVDRIRAQNSWLDEQLTNVRRARDEANGKLQNAEGEVASLKEQLEASKRANEDLNAQLTAARQVLDQTKHERDDYGMKHMAAQEELEKANAALAKFEEVLSGLRPKPVQEQTATPPYSPSVQTEPVTYQPHNW